jgi:hypothetical protein
MDAVARSAGLERLASLVGAAARRLNHGPPEAGVWVEVPLDLWIEIHQVLEGLEGLEPAPTAQDLPAPQGVQAGENMTLF